jgi:hypothetical protein
MCASLVSLSGFKIVSTYFIVYELILLLVSFGRTIRVVSVYFFVDDFSFPYGCLSLLFIPCYFIVCGK